MLASSEQLKCSTGSVRHLDVATDLDDTRDILYNIRAIRGHRDTSIFPLSDICEHTCLCTAGRSRIPGQMGCTQATQESTFRVVVSYHVVNRVFHYVAKGYSITQREKSMKGLLVHGPITRTRFRVAFQSKMWRLHTMFSDVRVER